MVELYTIVVAAGGTDRCEGHVAKQVNGGTGSVKRGQPITLQEKKGRA